MRRSAAAALKELIIERGLHPGDPMPTEAELMAELGVSRPTIREAVRTLVALDIPEVRHGTGPFVGQLSLRPRAIVAGASSYPRLIDFARLRAICDRVAAYLIVDMAHIAGLVAGGAHPSPVPYADVVSFTTHKVLRGPRSGAIVCTAQHAAAIDKAVFPMMQGGPQMHTIAAKAVNFKECGTPEYAEYALSLIHISEPTRLLSISYAVFCLKKKNTTVNIRQSGVCTDV